jgi:hypothetical protein
MRSPRTIVKNRQSSATTTKKKLARILALVTCARRARMPPGNLAGYSWVWPESGRRLGVYIYLRPLLPSTNRRRIYQSPRGSGSDASCMASPLTASAVGAAAANPTPSCAFDIVESGKNGCSVILAGVSVAVLGALHASSGAAHGHFMQARCRCRATSSSR